MSKDDDGRNQPPLNRVADLGAYIRNQRESAKLSLRNLAKQAGVSNPYLSQIERGLRKPSAEILQAIARALSISAESLYIRAGILEERDYDGNLELAIERDPHLADSQKAAMVEMYRSFRRLSELESNTTADAATAAAVEDVAAIVEKATRDRAEDDEHDEDDAAG